MSTVIKAENLGKKYIIGHQKQRYDDSLRDAMTHTARSIWQRLRHPLSPNRESIDLEELWALKDVNFEVQEGERIGIIGANGAGKSTLLKILSRITEPTTGKVRIKGCVSSLLEVGTGFHPELTGRENIFLNGAILGMTRQEVKRKFDEIVAFAELEKFLDTPVKRYSSGMYVRLAFAVAAHLEPEILIVDEVLAVGDAAFQKKCLGKMQNVAKEGRTVLFVSHNLLAVRNLCSRGIVLEEGKIQLDASAQNATDYYQECSVELKSNGEVSLGNWHKDRTSPGTARIKSVRTVNLQGEICSTFEVDSGIAIEVDLCNLSSNGFVLGISIQNSRTVYVYHVRNPLEILNHRKIQKEHTVRMTIRSLKLTQGYYTINIWLGNHLNRLEDRVGDVLNFFVRDDGKSFPGQSCIIQEQGDWEIVR